MYGQWKRVEDQACFIFSIAFLNSPFRDQETDMQTWFISEELKPRLNAFGQEASVLQNPR